LTKPKPNPQPKQSYYYLLEDTDVKRWYDSVARGSVATAAVWLRRMGFTHKNFGKTPQNLAKMCSKERANFVLEVVSNMEKGVSLFTRPSGSFLSLSRILLGQFNQTSCISVLADNDHEASYEKERDPPKEETR